MIEERTAREVVDAWDKGETIWSVEMGGLGPGYEQAIQVLIVELLRDNSHRVIPPIGDAETMKKWVEDNPNWGDDTVHRLNETCYGFSGAQVGAAKNVAMNILRRGYDTAINDPKIKDRLIQVSKSWPHAPEPVPT